MDYSLSPGIIIGVVSVVALSALARSLFLHFVENERLFFKVQTQVWNDFHSIHAIHLSMWFLFDSVFELIKFVISEIELKNKLNSNTLKFLIRKKSSRNNEIYLTKLNETHFFIQYYQHMHCICEKENSFLFVQSALIAVSELFEGQKSKTEKKNDDTFIETVQLEKAYIKPGQKLLLCYSNQIIIFHMLEKWSAA